MEVIDMMNSILCKAIMMVVRIALRFQAWEILRCTQDWIRVLGIVTLRIGLALEGLLQPHPHKPILSGTLDKITSMLQTTF